MYRNYYVIGKDELYHFNPNHDPRNGQFARGKGASITTKKKLIKREGDALVIDKERVGNAAKNIVSKTKKAYEFSKKVYNEADKKISEETRRNIVNSGDAKLVYENRHMLSKKELDDAINRINTERTLKELSKSDLRKTIDRGAEAVVKGATSGIELGVKRAVNAGINDSIKFGKAAVADSEAKRKKALEDKKEAAKKADEEKRKKKEEKKLKNGNVKIDQLKKNGLWSSTDVSAEKKKK